MRGGLAWGRHSDFLIDDGGGGNLGQRPRAPRAPGEVGRAMWESDTPRLREAPLCSHLRLLPKLSDSSSGAGALPAAWSGAHSAGNFVQAIGDWWADYLNYWG